MSTVHIAEFEEQFVLHFGGESSRINAYTLASTLVSIADAAKAANATINPGYEIEVVVESLGSGSFKATIKAAYSELGNLFSGDNLRAIVLGVIASAIYQYALAPDADIQVEVSEAYVIIEQGNKKFVIPKDIHDSVNELQASEPFKRSIGKAFEAVEKDEAVESLGIASNTDDPEPPIDIPRERFAQLTGPIDTGENNRVVHEFAELSISRAILDRSRRKWEFYWRGMKISAPVLDQHFYDEFFAHKITIAPGDSLEVDLKIHQVRNPDTGIFVNKRYEVARVIRHVPRLRQAELPTALASENTMIREDSRIKLTGASSTPKGSPDDFKISE